MLLCGRVHARIVSSSESAKESPHLILLTQLHAKKPNDLVRAVSTCDECGGEVGVSVGHHSSVGLLLLHGGEDAMNSRTDGQCIIEGKRRRAERRRAMKGRGA